MNALASLHVNPMPVNDERKKTPIIKMDIKLNDKVRKKNFLLSLAEWKMCV